MKTISFWQYFKLNKQTTLSCLKICTILFSAIATIISLTVSFTKGAEQDPMMVFIICELFGYGFSAFIFTLAILEGFVKTKAVLNKYHKIPAKMREDNSIELVRKPLNPKYWFMQLEIVENQVDDNYNEQSKL